MPEKVNLPNGSVLNIPDDLTQDQKNNLYSEAVKQASAEVEKPRKVGIPGVISPIEMKPSTFRGATDMIGEMAGGTAGAVAGSPGGVPGAMLGAGAGSALGKKGAREVQGVLGMNPRPYGLLDSVPDMLVGAGAEGVGRAIPAGIRGARNMLRGGADLPSAQANLAQLRGVGVTTPDLATVLSNTEKGFVDFQGVKKFLQRNALSSRQMRESAERTVADIQESFNRNWTISPEGHQLVPDVEHAGEFFRQGEKRVTKEWKDKGRSLYDMFFNKLPRETDVEWGATKEFLDNRASLDPVLGALTSDKMKGLHQALNDVYVTIYQRPFADGQLGTIEAIRKMPFDKMKALRSQVGNLISDWTPASGDLPRGELVDLHRALTADMKSAATKHGVLPEFETANKFWADNMSRQEDIFDKIAKKGKSDAKVGANIQRLAKSQDSKTIDAVREAFGQGSEEWHVIRNYIVKEMGTDNYGKFNLRQLARDWGGLGERTKVSLLGDGGSRKTMEKFLDAAEKFGYGLSEMEARSPFARWTQAEMLGPAAGLLGGSAYALGGGENKNTGWFIATVGALALLTPKVAVRLMTDPGWVEWAVKTQSRTPEQVMGSMARLGIQYATKGPEEQQAAQEFFGAFSQVMGLGGQQQSQPKGILTGGR